MRVSRELTDWPVDVDEETRLVPNVHARDCNLRAGGSGTAASDGDLCAGDVELGTAESRRAVDGNVLHTDQVVPRRKGPGNREGELARGCVNPPTPFSIDIFFFRKGRADGTD